MGARPDRLTVLVGAHYRALVRLADSLTAGGGDPERLVQDAFVRVLGRWGGGRDAVRTEALLRQDVVRRCRRVEAPDTTTADPVRAALAALPGRRREAVVLRLYAGLSPEQAAHAAGTSAAAVEHLLADGVADLRHLTDADDAADGVRRLLLERDDVTIRADGLDRIRRRLAARRSRLRPAAALLGLVLAGAGATYAVAATDAGPAPPRARPAPPEPTTCSGGLCTEPRPTPRPSDLDLPTTPGTLLVAVQDGHVVVADAGTGQVVHQLSRPDPGDVDLDPARGATDGVVWVRTRPDGCTSAILRIGLSHGASGVTVDAKPRHRRLPVLSDGGRVLAWVEGECSAGAPASVVVRGPDARFLTVAATTEQVTALDVRDDGAALVGLAARSYLLPPGATEVAAGIPLRGSAGCAVVAPAWDGAVATAWQQCSDRSRLTRFDARGRAVSTGARTRDRIRRTAVAGGFVLVVRADGTPARVTGGAVVPVPGGDRLGTASW